MNKIVVPTVPVGGNTKTPTVNPAKRWCFVLNNWNESEFCSICSKIKTLCSIGLIGKEVGENGTPHLQGYIEFKTKARPKSKFDNDRIHWDKCKGSREENITYCSKDGNVWYHGIDTPYKIDLKEFYDWETKIIEKLKEEPDDRTINWIWEPKGCAGKTTFCKWVYLNYDNVIVLSGKAADMKNAVMLYEKMEGVLPKIILIDIPRSTNTEFLSYQGIEEVKNMFFYSGKYEGGMVCGKPPHLFIFANERPNYEKCSKDRWKIINIEDLSDDSSDEESEV